jgi:hypothetical protein
MKYRYLNRSWEFREKQEITAEKTSAFADIFMQRGFTVKAGG